MARTREEFAAGWWGWNESSRLARFVILVGLGVGMNAREDF